MIVTSARFVAICSVFLRHPMKVFRAMPGNWKRVVLATDGHCPPETLPGIEVSRTPLVTRWSQRQVLVPEDREAIKSGQPRLYAGMVVLMYPLLAIAHYAGFMVPLLYRWSLKATCLIYLPIIYLIKNRYSEDCTATDYVQDFSEGKLERIIRCYSVVVMFVTLVPVGLLPGLPRVAQWMGKIQENGGPALILFQDLFIPTNGFILTFKLWHIARLANAAITLYLFYYADRAKRRLEHARWSEQDVKRRFDRLRDIQVFLAFYIMTCILVRLIRFGVFGELPSITFEVLPWR